MYFFVISALNFDKKNFNGVNVILLSLKKYINNLTFFNIDNNVVWRTLEHT